MSIEHGEEWSLECGIEGDLIRGTSRNDELFGTIFDDTINGGAGHDDLSGGSGCDTIRGGSGNDLICGDSGSDDLFGNSGRDTIAGGSGNDFINAGSGNDIACGGSGIDTILGGSGNDILIAGSGGMTEPWLCPEIEEGTWISLVQWGWEMEGFEGTIMWGGGDILNGGSGYDTLIGGSGNDVMTGGPRKARDIFVASEGFDVITDFQDGIDKIDFSGFGYEGVADFWIGAIDGGTAIMFGGSSLFLEGISPDQIDSSDFIYEGSDYSAAFEACSICDDEGLPELPWEGDDGPL